MKKATKKHTNKNAYVVPLFWVAFAAIILLLFVVNMPLIRRTLSATITDGAEPPPAAGESPTEVVPPVTIAPTIKEEDYPSLEDALAHLNDAVTGVEAQSTAEIPNAQPTARERPVYFMRMDTEGLLVRMQASRQFADASAPLQNTVTSLLAGPTTAEKARGLTTLIPEGTTLINAAMQGSTAVLNFNENFMFNTYGAEGYLAQLRQIIWTATEFPSVKNVQFLIEGQRVDFLGDNIRLDKPISREDLGQI
jgi:hypothetical protein